MAPVKKMRVIDSLEDKCLKIVLQSVISDLYLIHLTKTDLCNSLFLANLRKQSDQDLLQQTAQRLQILPGLLNDQVREKLISTFYTTVKIYESDKFPSLRLDLLKVLLNDSIVKLDFGTRDFPAHVLNIIGSKCPSLKFLKIILEECEVFSVYQSSDINLGTSTQTIQQKRLSLQEIWETRLSSFLEGPTPRKKRRRVSSVIPITLPKEVVTQEMHFQHLREASILHGASDELLNTLGQNAHHLKILKITQSEGVTDLGVKKLCLKNPENHGHYSHLHKLRVRSFHLNPCCRKLTEFHVACTSITPYGLAFLLKHLPYLQCLGECLGITQALEILVGNTLKTKYKMLPIIKAYPCRYKLVKVREEEVTSQKFMLLTSLCPDLGELYISNPLKEVDLGGSLEYIMNHQNRNVRGQIGQLKHLKRLSIGNIQISSVLEATRAVGQQLTYLRIFCKNIDLTPVFQHCSNLVTFILDGTYTGTYTGNMLSREEFDLLKPIALKKLEFVKIKPALHTEYYQLILRNSKVLREIEFCNLGEVDDDFMEQLIKCGHFNHLRSFGVKKAPGLTIKTANSLAHKCPKLHSLKDLGGWNISCIQYCKLQTEIEKANLVIALYFGYNNSSPDSEEGSSDESEYGSNVVEDFRNIFPIIVV